MQVTFTPIIFKQNVKVQRSQKLNNGARNDEKWTLEKIWAQTMGFESERTARIRLEYQVGELWIMQ